jgi:RNA recognition motif-containing protein
MRSEKIQGNVFVANLPVGLTDERLAELFDPFGLVLRAYLARDPATGETRGHGLVQLAPDRAVEEAIAGMNGQRLDGRRLDVRRADPTMSLVPSVSRAPRAESRPHAPREVMVEYVSARPGIGYRPASGRPSYAGARPGARG